ncbi:MAG: hypothetical protein ACLPX9_21150 [Rhodomicrobium sp.]
MAIETDKVEAILRQHWKIPNNLSPAVLQDLSFRIHVMVGQKYSPDNLKYQLRIMQTKDLKQDFDDAACDKIVSELFKTTRT